jgi:N-acetyltransferase
MLPAKPMLQPLLQNKLIVAQPLSNNDLEGLYLAAADPLLWEQHPNKNRYQRQVFETYFKGAIESGGALLVKDAVSQQIIGCSRYCDHNATENTISIGYTFFSRSHWGTGHNYALKQAMLNHIFQWVNAVTFYIGAVNKRSQISIERLGAIKTGEEETAYYGEAPKQDFIYTITKEAWMTNKYRNSIL